MPESLKKAGHRGFQGEQDLWRGSPTANGQSLLLPGVLGYLGRLARSRACYGAGPTDSCLQAGEVSAAPGAGR